ncbi:hypothetical protein H257_17435 [Aphanomyces astaci]|uniref:Peptidase M13 C-terminal domain-containing protein n=1 Tax=Aphanomyces astaci TaxID=112090 RepID=W4FGS2_APHAT|nr:hypothetical protein H257_17435 [Aphanomyces astaci]ETV65958.1 hypothetical protein H257_17435 [Aphanomyces astaci]|eukprot:XP_009844537.1 hypothetical protein H257_17435 [Aphanomyces astaci]
MVKIIVAGLSAGVASAFGTISEFPTEITSLMDQTVDPCTDFISYSCGTWYNKTTLHSKAAINMFTVIAAAADKVIEKLFNAKLPKLAEFYDSCMDTDTIDTLGLAPIEAHLKAIRSANSTVEAIFRGAAISNATGVNLFVKLSIWPDDADVTRNILSAEHPGSPFGREYFHEPLWADVEKPYRKYLATIFTLAGHAEVEAAIDVVIDFERLFAGVVLSKRTLQEAVTPRRLLLSTANASYPLGLGLPLQGFGLDVREGRNTTTVLVENHHFFDYLEEMLRRMHIDDLKTIIEYKVLDFNAQHLSKPFMKAWFDFYVMVSEGRKELPSRDRICRTQVQTSMGELLGSYYLKEVWTTDTAAFADSLVLKLKAAFKTELESAGWLDDTTRANCTTKMSKLAQLLGGPKNPKTYPTLTFDPKAYIANLNKVSAFDTAFKLAQIDTAVDKQIWVDTPAYDANAGYHEATNTLLFPAAIWQPPFYYAKADPSVNYAAIGSTIGHEITHGFDNNGAFDIDSDGKINLLWTANVTKTFDEKSKCFIEQYGSMDVKSELTGDFLGKLDGKLTLRETIADNGGLNTAYRAYRDYVHAEAEATKYTKETGEKMFWISHAQLQCAKNSDEYLQYLLTREHPPSRYRLIGSVQNSVDFAKAFNCPVDSPMNPTKKCVLWE